MCTKPDSWWIPASGGSEILPEKSEKKKGKKRILQAWALRKLHMADPPWTGRWQPAMGTALSFDLQFIQLQKFLDDPLLRLLHLRVRAEENRLGFVKKYHPVSQLLGQPHVMRHNDAGQIELSFQPLDQVAQQLRH